MTDPNQWRPLFSPDHHSDRIDRVWKDVKADLRSQDSPDKNRTTKFFLIAISGASTAAAMLLFFLWPVSSPRPLATDRGAPITGAIFDPEMTVRKFSDGSTLDVSTNTAIDLLENTGKAVRFSLKKGRARFDITPGGPRLWQVVCGEVSVVVLGTIFTVERDESQVRVNVERGEVSVRGNGVKCGEERLAAGQSVQIDAEGNRVSSPKPPQPPERVAPERPAPKQEEKKPEDRRQKWKLHAKAGNYSEAFAELGSSGVARLAKQTQNVDELFQLADVARFSGHTNDAVAPLSAIIDHYASSSKAGLAAYTLGRLYLDQLSMPDRAARSLDKALTLGIPAALREAAMANQIKALSLQNSARGSVLAKEYLERYPKGRYRGQVEEWTKGASNNQ